MVKTVGRSQGMAADGALKHLVISSLRKYNIKTLLMEMSLHLRLTHGEIFTFEAYSVKVPQVAPPLQKTNTVKPRQSMETFRHTLVSKGFSEDLSS